MQSWSCDNNAQDSSASIDLIDEISALPAPSNCGVISMINGAPAVHWFIAEIPARNDTSYLASRFPILVAIGDYWSIGTRAKIPLLFDPADDVINNQSS